jgi:eukaryotic-like serine/threonine-protein kinase
MIGKVFGHCRVLEKIAPAGMREVFLAEDTSLHREVVLKLLRPWMQQDPTALKRSIREARSAARWTIRISATSMKSGNPMAGTSS